MRLRRPLLIAIILILTLSPYLLAPPAARAADGWLPGPPMLTPHAIPEQLLLLPDGQILVFSYVTVESGSLQTVLERYNPTLNQWFVANPPPTTSGGRAVVLRDGSVLYIADGSHGRGEMIIARYLPATDEWRIVTSYGSIQLGFQATVLPDGRVLVVGAGYPISALGTQIYDPETDRWQEASPTNFGRKDFTLVSLQDGRVMLLGGTGEGEYRLPRELDFRTSTEIYDPATDRWTVAAPSIWPHGLLTATLLLDGSVLVVSDATAERYNPATNTWHPTEPPGERHYFRHSAVSLSDGRVLVLGGWGGCLSRTCARETQSAEIYDPQTNAWTPVAPPSANHVVNVATRLLDGRAILISATYAPSSPRPDRAPPPPPPPPPPHP
ncbi:MAG: hypothetical protein U0841_34275, partial [Chloroflexia bacterium]